MNDATLRAMVVCMYAFQNKANRWNLIGIIDTINVERLPCTIPKIGAWLQIADPPPSGVARLDLKDASDNLVASTGQKSFGPVGAGKDAAHIAELFNVNLTTSGPHRLEVYVDNQPIGSWRLIVNVGPIPQPQP